MSEPATRTDLRPGDVQPSNRKLHIALQWADGSIEERYLCGIEVGQIVGVGKVKGGGVCPECQRIADEIGI